MINLLASLAIIATVVSPAPSPDCVGDTTVPIVDVSVSILCPPPAVVEPILGPPLSDLLPPLPPPPPLVLPIGPPVKVHMPPLPPIVIVPPAIAPAPPVTPVKPPVVSVPVPVVPARPIPIPVPVPAHTTEVPPPSPTPTPVPSQTATTSAPLQTLKTLGTGAPKPSAAAESPEAPKHRQPPFDNGSVAGIIGNTVSEFPELGWILIALAGLGLIVLNEKLDESPKTKKIGRHSSKLN